MYITSSTDVGAQKSLKDKKLPSTGSLFMSPRGCWSKTIDSSRTHVFPSPSSIEKQNFQENTEV